MRLILALIFLLISSTSAFADRRRRQLALGMLILLVTGCISTQIRPEASRTTSVTRIIIIPVEPPPLEATSYAPELAHIGVMSTAPVLGAHVAAAGLALVAGIVLVVDLAKGFSEEHAMVLPPEAASLQDISELQGIWIPTTIFAEEAAVKLKATRRFDVETPQLYYKLPIAQRVATKYLENWFLPIRRWYNQDVSIIDYRDIGPQPTDAILEIGVAQYALYGGKLWLQVFSKLVEPSTGAVIGRTRAYNFNTKLGAVDRLMSDDAKEFKELVRRVGGELVTKNLRTLNLVGR